MSLAVAKLILRASAAVLRPAVDEGRLCRPPHDPESAGSPTDPVGGPSAWIETIGRRTITGIVGIGDLALFTWQTFRWIFKRLPRRSVFLQSMYSIGVLSIPVVMITGAFTGMVLAVQSYDQFKLMHMETRLGAVINITLVKELGPVLAATMLAGRVGSSMAAELGTMRITEQIDALRALGANPIRHLVVPRFLSCLTLIPLLAAVADGVGIAGGWMLSTQVLGIDSFHYWHHAVNYVTAYDVMTGVVKSIFFGGAIGAIACHRGFHCSAGAEGVGRAATQSFVYAFVAILVIDFFMGMFFTSLYQVLWPSNMTLVFGGADQAVDACLANLGRLGGFLT